jgi:hypothetical protein
VRFLFLFSAVAIIAACAATPQTPQETLDPVTSVTLTSTPTPLVLYRDNPAVAAHARKLLYLGPIEVNRTGLRTYFMWVGIWSTAQAPDMASQLDGFDSIVLYADGEPLLLEAAGFTPDAIGASIPVYQKPVPWAADAYYRVTVDQIRLLASARDVRLRTTGLNPREFSEWDAQAAAREGFARFVEATVF